MAESKFGVEQFNLFNRDGMAEHYWQRSRAEVVAHFLKKHQIDSFRFLEIGCARGIALKLLRQKGIDVYGSELADVAPLKEVEEFIFSGRDANVLESSFRASIRGILLLDVIEHIESPHEFLGTLFGSFPEVKHIVVTVPARMELWSNYDTYWGHHLRYDLAGIEELAERAACEPIENRYFFKLLYLPLLFLKNRKLATNPPSPSATRFHSLLTWYFKMESRLFPAWLAGSSIFALLKK